MLHATIFKLFKLLLWGMLMLARFRSRHFVLLCTIFTVLFGTHTYAYQNNNGFDPYTPVFTDTKSKILDINNSVFLAKLIKEAEDYEPLLIEPGTQVHMGFWSGPGNRGSLVRVLDDINYGATPCSNNATPNCAIWDEGATTAQQYPAYVLMMTEQWYTRANANSEAEVIIYGKRYLNASPLNFSTADLVWGLYSQRYAEMARTFHTSTGKRVKVWCFTIGAKRERIFYSYEYPLLQQLEKEGVIDIYFAKTQSADWKKADDWTAGTASAPPPTN